jgi:hypothetical protein
MTYLTEVVADSPIHYWRMADAGGYRLADIGSASHASFTPNGGSSLATIVPYTGPNSDGGSAASGVRLLTFPPIVGGSAFSIECLAWAVNKGSAYSLALEVQTDTAQYAKLSVNPGAFSSWSLGSGPSTITGSHSVSSENWHHYVLTNDGTTVRAYFDSLTDGTGSPPGMSLYPLGVNIFGDHNNANEKSGLWLSEVALYTTALSPTRINAHFLALPSMSSPVWKGTSTSDTGSISDDLSAIHSAVIRSVIIPGQI